MVKLIGVQFGAAWKLEIARPISWLHTAPSCPVRILSRLHLLLNKWRVSSFNSVRAALNEWAGVKGWCGSDPLPGWLISCCRARFCFDLRADPIWCVYTWSDAYLGWLTGHYSVGWSEFASQCDPLNIEQVGSSQMIQLRSIQLNSQSIPSTRLN